MANDIFASLLHALGTAGKSYGQSRMRSIEEESAARKKEADEAEKRKQQLADQQALFDELGKSDPKFKFLSEKAKSIGRPLSDSDRKLLLESYSGEQDMFKMFGDELEKMIGQGGVDWRGAAQAEGITPASILTNEGKASAASRLVDYGRFSDLNMNQPQTMMPDGVFTGAISTNPEWVRRVEKMRTERAILKAKNEKQIADIKNPQKSPFQEGVELGQKELGKRSVVGDETAKTKAPVTPLQYSGYIDRFVKNRQEKFLSDLASELGVDDDNKMTRELLVQKAKEGLSKTSTTLLAWPKGDLLPGETKPAPDTYWSNKLKEYDAINTEWRKQITDNPTALTELDPSIDWEAVVAAKGTGKTKKAPSGVRPPEQLPSDWSKLSTVERKYWDEVGVSIFGSEWGSASSERKRLALIGAKKRGEI